MTACPDDTVIAYLDEVAGDPMTDPRVACGALEAAHALRGGLEVAEQRLEALVAIWRESLVPQGERPSVGLRDEEAHELRFLQQALKGPR